MKICNLNYLKSISPSNPKFIADMIQLFLKNAPPAIAAIKSSLPTKDWGTIQFHAHKLRSHIDCMGMSKEYTDMAQQIEEYAKQQENINSITSLSQKLETIFEKAYIELKAELNYITYS